MHQAFLHFVSPRLRGLSSLVCAALLAAPGAVNARMLHADTAASGPIPTPTAIVVGAAGTVNRAQPAAAAPIPAPASAIDDCPRPTGQLITETIPSAVITAVPMFAHVFLPPCYSKARKYPVLYLIHGTAFELGGWVSDGVPRVADIRMSLGTLPRFLIVMPGVSSPAR